VTESVPETDVQHVAKDPETARAADVEAEQHLVPHVKQKSLLRWAVEIALSVGVAVAIFAVVLPRVTGSSYAEVWDVLGELQAWQFLLLAVAWLVNMVMYTGVLTASLPGLTHPQAFVANLSSSAVSNVLPFGGAVGVAATYLMYGSWGFGAGAITRSILVSGVWNVLVKLAMPAVAFVVLAATGELSPVVAVVAVLGVVVFAATVGVLWLVLHSDTFAAAVGRATERALTALARLVRRRPVTGVEARFVAFRHESRNLIVDAWVPLSVWIALYNLTQFGLFLLCLEVLPDTAHDLGWAEAFAAFTVGRLLSNVSVTPSGVGFVEAGMAGLLVAAGGDPATVTAGVLLFSAFTYLAEIPVGAAGWLVWATRSSWRSPERRGNDARV
jgi:uncharacterized membrane protein YbhN (UPF0104 family)